MIGALIILAITVITGILLYTHHRLTTTPDDDAVVEPKPSDECCGQHEVCEKESLLAAVSKGQIEYYEDEELDAFRGRPADQYSEAETESFRDVLYTMRSEEVAGWVRSLALRGVELPDGLKDEVVMIVSERRTATL